MKLRLRPVDAVLVLAIIFVLYLTASPIGLDARTFRLVPRPRRLDCPPEAYTSGHWQRQPGNIANITSPNDVFALSGWSGCASLQDPSWHLATKDPAMYHWRTEASMARWKWIPGPGCARFRRFSSDEFVRNLVERGGWLLVGDSLTEEHFFALSCVLHPHVRAEPQWDGEGDHYVRAWIQSMYLLPTSPLVRTLRFPAGFDIEQTPLVTFRRADVLFPADELVPVYTRVTNRTAPAPGTGVYRIGLQTIPSVELFALFTAPAPYNYGTLVVSSGAHWTQYAFDALEPKVLIELFGAAARVWVQRAAAWSVGRRQVVIRGATWGTEDCLTERVRMGGAVDEIPVLKTEVFNWSWISRLNEAFAHAVSERSYPNVHYLGVERPTMLRPDAHVLADCLHLAVGTGVVETWTEYIAHFLWGEVS